MNRGSVLSQDKLFLHGDRVKQYLEHKKTIAPVTMELDLTDRCNNACPSCVGMRTGNVDIPYNVAHNIISDMADLGVRGLIFTGGGEPLLYDGVGELVKHAKDKKLDVGFITSGQMPKTMQVGELEDVVYNASWIRVSLDAGSPEAYKLTHGLPADNYFRAINFIRKCSDIKNRFHSNTTIGVGYLTGLFETEAAEINDIEQSAYICAKVGADYFQLRPAHRTSRSPKVRDELRKLIRDEHSSMKIITSEHKYKFMKDQSRTYDYCHGTRFASVISASGKLYACCHLRNKPEGFIADLNKTNLSSAWSSGLVEDATATIDVSKCVPLCRCDNINRSLDELVKGYDNAHKSFL